MSRTQSRQIIIHSLYAADLNNDFSKDFFLNLINNFPFDDIVAELTEEDKIFVNEIIEGVVENKDTIDAYISRFSEGWKMDRIAKVELAILRESIYEICYRNDIPVEVVVNEAVENSKKYGKEISYRFVNGILASVIKEERDG